MNTELYACVLCGSVLFLLLPRSERRSRLQRFGVWIACVLLVSIPIGPLSIGGYLRSVTSDPSMVALALVLWGVVLRVGGGPKSPIPDVNLLLIGVLGLAMYPSALGLTFFDSYRFGYQPVLLLWAIGALASVAALRGDYRLTVALCAATVAFTFRLTESDNYWDYLLDPLLVAYCWAVLAVRGIKRLLDGDRMSVEERGVPAVNLVLPDFDKPVTGWFRRGP